MLRLGFSHGVNAQLASGGAAATTPVTVIAANGWELTYPGVTALDPIGNPKTIPMTRAAFDASGNATTVSESLLITSQLAQLYPTSGTFGAWNYVANAAVPEDFIYSSACDTVPAGCTNNSALVSPKPVCNWVTTDRRLVGNSISIEAIGFHRNRKSQKWLACMVPRATDTVPTTVTGAAVSSTSISAQAGDKAAVKVYPLTVDITTLATGMVTFNAKAFPRIGVAASVNDSNDSTIQRGFSPRFFLKNVTRAANPPVAYVTDAAYTSGGDSVPVGVDATGVWSTTPLTAKNNPFLTVKGAIDAIITQSGVTGGVVDGCRIRIGVVSSPRVLVSAVSGHIPQQVAELVIERDPTITKAQARVSFGAAAWQPRIGKKSVDGGALILPIVEGMVRFFGLTIERTGAQSMEGRTDTVAAPLHVVLEDCEFASGGFNNAFVSNGRLSMVGLTMTGTVGTSVFGASASTPIQLVRGVTATTGNGNFVTEGFCVVGNEWTLSGVMAYGGRTANLGIIAFNKFWEPSNSGALVYIGAAEDITGFVITQNILDTKFDISNVGVRVSADGPTDIGNTSHVIITDNTIGGAQVAGRFNLFYDQSTPNKLHTLMLVTGNISPQLNIKGDRFTLNAAKIGSRAIDHGVGAQGNWAGFATNAPTTESQVYPGMRSTIGASNTVWTNPNFTDYRGTTYTTVLVAGVAGNSDFTLTGGSGARGIVLQTGHTHDINGVALVADGNGRFPAGAIA